MKSIGVNDLEQVVLTLGRESERLAGGAKRARAGGFRRLLFLLLRLVAYSIPIALALLLVLTLFEQQRGALGVIGLFLYLPLATTALIVLLLLNLPLLVAAWRQRRSIVARDLVEPALPQWQRTAPWQRKLLWPLAGLTLVAAYLAFVSFPDEFGWEGFALYVIGILLPYLVSLLRLAERNLEILGKVGKLRARLEHLLAEARREGHEQVELPHELAVRLADISAGVSRIRRVQAIDEAMRGGGGGFAVSQSGAFRRRLAELDPAVRLALADRLYQLAVEPRPEGARREESGGRWVWPLEDLSLTLVYEIVDESEQVLLRDAREI